MLALELFKWWYLAGWKLVAAKGGQQVGVLSETFSIKILLHTLFAPWRRIISYPGAGAGAHFRAGIDNAISRLVGFFVRLLVLAAAAVLLIITLIFEIIGIVLWPLLPPAVIGLIIWGLI